MKKFDIYQYKATLLFVCCVVLIGAGACSVVSALKYPEERAIKRKNDQKAKQLFEEIKAKIDNNQATANDYYFFAYMVRSDSFLLEIGHSNLTWNAEKRTRKSEKMYIDYLQKAMNKGSQEAKLDYAQFLFDKNDNIIYEDVDNKEKQEKYLKLKQSLNLIEEVFKTQCKVYAKPDYPNFHDYRKETITTKQYMYWFFNKWNDMKSLKPKYPELYQQVQKVKNTYEDKCNKEAYNQDY